MREKDTDWEIHKQENGKYSFEVAQLAVLMDLRDELKRLNALLHCSNFTDIPRVLRGIRQKLPTLKRRKQPLKRSIERGKKNETN